MSQKQAKAERKSAKEAEKVKGWKIDLRPYTVRVMDITESGQVKTKDGKPVWIEDDFDVQGSLADIMFNRELNLKAEEAFEVYEVVKKIRAAKTHVILDSKEMALVKKAYDALKGVNENMVEFCRRIRDAEEISLKEAEGDTED